MGKCQDNATVLSIAFFCKSLVFSIFAGLLLAFIFKGFSVVDEDVLLQLLVDAKEGSQGRMSCRREPGHIARAENESVARGAISYSVRDHYIPMPTELMNEAWSAVGTHLNAAALTCFLGGAASTGSGGSNGSGSASSGRIFGACRSCGYVVPPRQAGCNNSDEPAQTPNEFQFWGGFIPNTANGKDIGGRPGPSGGAIRAMAQPKQVGDHSTLASPSNASEQRCPLEWTSDQTAALAGHSKCIECFDGFELIAQHADCTGLSPPASRVVQILHGMRAHAFHDLNHASLSQSRTVSLCHGIGSVNLESSSRKKGG